MLRDFVPVFLRYPSLNAPRLYLVQPLVDGQVFLCVSAEYWAVCPLFVDGLQIEWLYLECVEHCENEDVSERRKVSG